MDLGTVKDGTPIPFMTEFGNADSDKVARLNRFEMYSDDGTFKNGQTYNLIITVQPKDGYCLADETSDKPTSILLKMNGKTVNGEVQFMSEDRMANAIFKVSVGTSSGGTKKLTPAATAAMVVAGAGAISGGIYLSIKKTLRKRKIRK